MKIKKQTAKAQELLQAAARHLQKGEFQQAEYLYKKVLRDQKNNPHAYFGLGFVYKEQRRLDEAITCYKRAVLFNSNYFLM